MVATSRSGRDGIKVVTGSMAPEYPQVSRYGGTSTNDIFVEETDGEGSGLAVYCLF